MPPQVQANRIKLIAAVTCKFESEFALKFDLVYFSAMIFMISQTTLLAARSDFTGRYS